MLAIAGSLRAASFNRRLAEVAAAIAPPSLQISVYADLASVPLFNEDLETTGVPTGVERLRRAVERADGLLIATPEYNQSLPGVVKNMVDWLSRGDPVVIEDKPVVVLGATPGAWGTRIAQSQLRHALAACGALVMPAPQFYLRGAADLFDEHDRLIDTRMLDSLHRLLAAYDVWLHRLRLPAIQGRSA
ncbi:MAG TPA: NADPH-dependent FMN reductase [Steroidobacteraceae bacterium]|nr:NADPH-dependent FMN reductase [Steroidobacteraceae bacterium]